ncbi:glycosyltransferase, partial [bacterium]|nr:glycosyltransferase [bacterium]
SIRDIAEDESVFLHENVKDPAPYLAGCDLSVSPVRVCSGYPNKIVEALHWGRHPVVSYREGVEGLPASIRAEIAIAENPAQWVETIASLVNEGRMSGERVERIQTVLYDELNDDRILSALEEVYDRALESR